MDKTLDGQELKAMQQAPSGGEHETEVRQPTRRWEVRHASIAADSAGRSAQLTAALQEREGDSVGKIGLVHPTTAAWTENTSGAMTASCSKQINITQKALATRKRQVRQVSSRGVVRG